MQLCVLSDATFQTSALSGHVHVLYMLLYGFALFLSNQSCTYILLWDIGRKKRYICYRQNSTSAVVTLHKYVRVSIQTIVTYSLLYKLMALGQEYLQHLWNHGSLFTCSTRLFNGCYYWIGEIEEDRVLKESLTREILFTSPHDT